MNINPARDIAAALPSTRRLGLMLAAAGALALMQCRQPAAQSIDYKALEDVFGEPVTSSATGKPQRASEAPVNMEIITQDDIRRSGGVSIPDVLQFVAGVDVRETGMADAQVGIRGYNQPYNPRLLVLVNGRQVYADDYGRVPWSSIPVQLEEIRQIEVIKGPNSALYGFNAASGVINIITYNPLYDSINTATIRAGTQGYAGGSAVATARVSDSAGVRISLGGFHSRDYPPGNLSANDAGNRQSPAVANFSIDGRVRIAPGVEANVEATLGDSRVAQDVFSGTYATLFTRSNSLRAGLSADTSLGLFNVSAYRNQQLVSAVASGLGDGRGIASNDVYVLQASDLVKLGASHTVRIGIEYRNNEVSSATIVQGTVGYEVYSGNLMWDWRITPGFSVTNAVRVDSLHLRYAGTPAAGSGLTVADYNRAGFTEVSFNSGAVFQPTETDTIRLTAARGLQAPSLIDFGLQTPANTLGATVVAGNPGLRPSIVYNIELDYDRTMPALGSILRTAVFAQRNEDLISQALGVPPVVGPLGSPLLLAANVGSSNALGMEIGVRGHSESGLRWNGSYSFVVTTDHTDLNRGNVFTSAIDYAHSVPRHVVAFGLGYTHDRLEMDLMGRWQSSYRDYRGTGPSILLQPVEVPNYITLNARVGYKMTDHMTLAASVQQFNISRLMQTAGPLVERRAIVSLNARF